MKNHVIAWLFVEIDVNEHASKKVFSFKQILMTTSDPSTCVQKNVRKTKNPMEKESSHDSKAK